MSIPEKKYGAWCKQKKTKSELDMFAWRTLEKFVSINCRENYLTKSERNLQTIDYILLLWQLIREGRKEWQSNRLFHSFFLHLVNVEIIKKNVSCSSVFISTVDWMNWKKPKKVTFVLLFSFSTHESLTSFWNDPITFKMNQF